ncbi:hypothetical protein TNCV_107241 [Trichonephila clavipes]|nr:hypothetical protein TNCV_107241 [Trichonephila clavipes]
MRSSSSALAPPLNKLIYPQILTQCDCFVSMSTMSQRSHLTDSEAWKVVGRLEGGQTQAEVPQAFGVSQSVISRIWNRFLETGSAGRRTG